MAKRGANANSASATGALGMVPHVSKSVSNVDFRRIEYRRKFMQWRLIRDCLEGEISIKRNREIYLPRPGTLTDPDNEARYEAYITRANFYGVAQYTIHGMIGQVFSREPVIEFPNALKDVIDDITGTGISASQLAKAGVGETASVGRGGLFVDYPDTTQAGGATMADLANGKVRPWVELIKAENIINWRKAKVGGIWRLTLVVFEEFYDLEDDGFELTKGIRWRVLRLVNGAYQLETWYDTDATPSSVSVPVDAQGKPFDTLPFMFLGAANNDAEIGDAPSYQLCSLNIGHYRNSADYEEAVFLMGQPTPWITGLTKDWVANVWKTNKILLGSRAAIVLPVGASAGLLQPSANSMPREAMDQKELQMVAIGAKLVQPRNVAATATEVTSNDASQMSVLQSCAANVGYAMEWALSWCCAFMGISETGIKYKLNTEFDLIKMTPQEQQQVIASWQTNAISFSEMRGSLKRSGIASMPDDKAQAEIDAYNAAHPPAPVAMNPAMRDLKPNGPTNTNNPPGDPANPPKLTNNNPAAV